MSNEFQPIGFISEDFPDLSNVGRMGGGNIYPTEDIRHCVPVYTSGQVRDLIAAECQRLTTVATASEEAARMYAERSARWEQEAQRLAAERDRMGAELAEARALNEQAICIWCGEVGTKEPEAMLAHAVKCEKRRQPSEEIARMAGYLDGLTDVAQQLAFSQSLDEFRSRLDELIDDAITTPTEEPTR